MEQHTQHKAPRQTDFSTGSVYKNILSVALPMTVAQLINLLYNIVDRIYIGRIPGTGTMALSGVGLCFPIIHMISAFSALYGSGGSPLCAMERGRGNDEEAERIMGTSATMLIGTGVALTVLCLALHRPILQLFGASDATMPYAAGYIRIYLLGTVSVMVTLGLNPFINSQGFGRTGMYTVLLGAIANILLDPLFIFAFDMGVQGAALATVLSQSLSALWVLRFLTGGQAVLRLKFDRMRVRWRRARGIMALGLSGFVMNATNGVVQVACNVTLQQFGGDLYVGVMTVLTSLREVVTMPVFGLNNGASPCMSFNYGERRFDRVRQAIRFVTLTSVAITLVVWALFLLLPAPFIRIFNNDAELVAAAIPALHIYFFGFVMMALQFAGQTVFVALGKSKQAVFFSLLRKVVIVTPLTVVLPRLGMGVNGVFYAEPISNLIGGLACFLTMLVVTRPELRSGVREASGKKSGA